MTSIDDITSEFGEVYLTVKGTKTTDGWEKILKDAQVEFFAAATRELENKTLARKTVTNWAANLYPGWRLVEEKDNKAIIEEDPSVKAFAHLNTQDGMVYRRSQTQGGPSLDVERLQEKEPDLYDEISVWSPSVYNMVRDAMVWAYNSYSPEPEVLAAEEAEKFLETLSQSDDSLRIILDPAQWTPQQATKLTPYIIPGKVSVRLTPPRKAKPSELETGEIEDS
jgi:hypothetical protein